MSIAWKMTFMMYESTAVRWPTTQSVHDPYLAQVHIRLYPRLYTKLSEKETQTLCIDWCSSCNTTVISHVASPQNVHVALALLLSYWHGPHLQLELNDEMEFWFMHCHDSEAEAFTASMMFLKQGNANV